MIKNGRTKVRPKERIIEERENGKHVVGAACESASASADSEGKRCSTSLSLIFFFFSVSHATSTAADIYTMHEVEGMRRGRRGWQDGFLVEKQNVLTLVTFPSTSFLLYILVFDVPLIDVRSLNSNLPANWMLRKKSRNGSPVFILAVTRARIWLSSLIDIHPSDRKSERTLDRESFSLRLRLSLDQLHEREMGRTSELSESERGGRRERIEMESRWDKMLSFAWDKWEVQRVFSSSSSFHHFISQLSIQSLLLLTRSFSFFSLLSAASFFLFWCEERILFFPSLSSSRLPLHAIRNRRMGEPKERKKREHFSQFATRSILSLSVRENASCVNERRETAGLMCYIGFILFSVLPPFSFFESPRLAKSDTSERNGRDGVSQ